MMGCSLSRLCGWRLQAIFPVASGALFPLTQKGTAVVGESSGCSWWETAGFVFRWMLSFPTHHSTFINIKSLKRAADPSAPVEAVLRN